MKTKNTSGRILLMVEKPSGFAFDELGSRDPVEQLATWCLANLSFAQIGMLTDRLTRDAVPPPDPDADDEEIERGQRIVEGKQAQDTARLDRRYGHEPTTREGVAYDRTFGRSGHAQDSALGDLAYDKMFPSASSAKGRGQAQDMHNWRSEAAEFVPQASGFGADDDSSYEALFGKRP